MCTQGAHPNQGVVVAAVGAGMQGTARCLWSWLYAILSCCDHLLAHVWRQRVHGALKQLLAGDPAELPDDWQRFLQHLGIRHTVVATR